MNLERCRLSDKLLAAQVLSDYSFLVLTSRILDETSLRHIYQAGFTDPPKNLAGLVEWSELCLTLCPEGDFVLKKYVGKDGMEIILDLFMDQKYAVWFRCQQALKIDPIASVG